MTESAEAPKSDVTPAGGHFCGAQLAGRARVERDYDWNAKVAQILDVYAEAMRLHAARAA
jgi:hypothetical protein